MSSNRALIPFTNEHFAAFCLKMVGQPYWMGTCLYQCTNDLLSRKKEQYPSSYSDSRMSRYKKDISAKKVCADCIGAAKGYAWTNGGVGVLESIGTGSGYTRTYGANDCPDKGADGMFSYAKKQGMAWGDISTLPETVGVVLHKPGHVGYYVGGGYAVEWQGFSTGCVKTKVAGRGWKHWFNLPFIRYEGAGTLLPLPDADKPVDRQPSASVRSLSRQSPMMTGEDVRALQISLNKLGFACGTTDGIFGKKTEAAVRAFQAAKKLEVDGIVGQNTRAALELALQPMDEQTGTSGVETQPEQNEHVESTSQAGSSETFIKICMTRAENIAVYGAEPISLNLEEYLRGVIPSEMYESTNLEALKAQAICSRTYAYRRRNTVLSDTSKNQLFSVSKIGKNPRSDEAIAATRDMILTYKGKVVDCFYCASNKGQTKRSGDVWSTHYPYYVNKRDEWDEAAREDAHVMSFGHGIGMSQHGAMWAARKGVSCAAILAFYYEGAVISGNYGQG